ncbi:MAG: phosphoribosyltransferase family protein [Candidatus Nealsonbacteria bacterium]
MNREEIKRIFAETGTIIINDHFVYARKADGWYHGGEYVNKDAIYPFTRFVSLLCKEIADHFWGNDIDVVVGPTVGGVILAQWTAHWYAPFAYQKEVLAVYADEEDILQEMTGGQGTIKVGTRRILKRGYDKIVKGRRCLVVEDVINTGATVKKTIEAIRLAGGDVVGVGALANRSGGKVTAETVGAPELFSLLDLDMKMFKEEECSICKEKGPKSVRTDLGKGKEFLTRTGNL